MFLALLKFACWEAALFSAAIALVGGLGRSAEERCLLILGVEVTLESSLAGLFSFTHTNSPAAYWIAAAVLAMRLRCRERGAFCHAPSAACTWCVRAGLWRW